MRGLLALVVVMGAMIVAGLGVIGVTVAHRLTHVESPSGTPFAVVAEEPAGTQITGVSGLGDRLAIVLRGGGPDRIVLVAAGDGRVLGTIRLAR